MAAHAELAAELFPASDRCIACHSNVHAADGTDVSIGYDWRASMMANSALDPYWHAGVRREVMDHPAAQALIEDTCSTCHMPIDRFAAALAGGQGRVFANVGLPPSSAPAPAAADGVSCTVCHQIDGGNFGTEESFDGGFAIDTNAPPGARRIFGPYAVDSGRAALMESATRVRPAESVHLQQSELCATCHTLFTHALNEAGEPIARLPEQVPYLEWLESEYRASASCQSCHMPEVPGEVPMSSVLGEPRPNVSRHVFQGGNAFMLGVLARHRGELGVKALPQELDAAIARTKEYLATATARVRVEPADVRAGRLVFDVHVENLAGHKFPTAYPSRRAWLHVKVTDGAGAVVFESGAVGPDGAIAGNDNDADGGRFEPHYDEIERADQVQIYEPIMVGADGRVTTGLLSGVRYAKDNRLLPRGFDKARASPDVAVQGAAREDPTFVAGGDRVRYAVDVGGARGPFAVEAELLFQSIGYRWAENLRAYAAPETERFLAFYREAAPGSALRVATATLTLETAE
ncbi:MAG TPA: hypothetical protein VIN61_05545 [Gammaproteobacteria bacterium]